MMWTESEDKILKEIYSKNNKNYILSLLPNRTWFGIKVRAAKTLKLYRDTYYSKDENFFETPNLVNCWVSGYIAGDSNLNISGKYDTKKVSFELKSDDIDLLEEIKRVTKFDGEIKFRTRNFKIKSRKNSKKLFYEGVANMAFMHMYSAEKWHRDLYKNWKLIPNKAKRLESPNISDLTLSLAFISGNICADGNIDYNYNPKKNSKSLNITFLGTEKFLSWIKDVLNKVMKDPNNSSVRRERKDSELFCYKIASIKSYLISKMILSLDIYHMKRKWDICREFINMVEKLDVSSRFISRLRKSLNPQIINFVKGTNQEFSEDFLRKIGYVENIP